MSKQETIKQILLSARQELLETVDQIDEASWQTAVYTEDSIWTVLDLLRHIADSQQSMSGLMLKIKETGEGVPADFDLSRWNQSRVAKSRHKEKAELLTQLATDQTLLFAFIDVLTDEDWDKAGRHGSGNILTISQICETIAGHERIHARDIRQATGLKADS